MIDEEKEKILRTFLSWSMTFEKRQLFINCLPPESKLRMLFEWILVGKYPTWTDLNSFY